MSDEGSAPSTFESYGGPTLEPGLEPFRTRGQLVATLVAQVEPEARGVVVTGTQSHNGVLASDDRPILFVSVGIGDQGIEHEVSTEDPEGRASARLTWPTLRRRDGLQHRANVEQGVPGPCL